MATIFYSWQSDLPNRCNRGLIETALESAVKQLRQDPAIVSALRDELAVDKDTKGVAGSPDIVSVILNKIEAGDACVFDVSIATRGDRRVAPNPNVLIELGYAMKTHSSERVILIFNTAFGAREELPFDLRHKRVLSYHAEDKDESLATVRSDLARELRGALELVYIHLDENRFSRDEHEFYIVLYNNITSFLDAVAEDRHRQLQPWSTLFFSDCGSTASHLAELAADDVAGSHPDLVGNLKSLGQRLSAISHIERGIGPQHELDNAVHSAAAEAQALIHSCLPALEIRLRKMDRAKEKRLHARRAVDQFEILALSLEQRDMKSLKNTRRELSKIGRELLQVSHRLLPVKDPDALLFRQAGHALHLSEIRGTEEIGFHPEAALHAHLTPIIQQLRPFLGGPS